MKQTKHTIISILSLLMLFIVLTSCNPQQQTWLRGIAEPNNSFGKNGDMYLDTDDGDLYNKQQDTWIRVGNLQGPLGPSGADGEDGLGIVNAKIVNQELIFVLSDHQEINSGKVATDSSYNVSISDGVLNIVTKKTFEDVNSIAFGNKTFNEIFVNNNLLSAGNLIDNNNFGSWDTTNGVTKISKDHYSTKDSSLLIEGTKDYQNIKSFTGNDQGKLYLGSLVMVESYSKGVVGMFSRIAGNNNIEGMIDSKTIGFEVASQIINHDQSSLQIVMGTDGNTNIKAYLDTAVVINLSKVFGGDELPTKEDLDELLKVYARFYNGERDISVYRNYCSSPKVDEIPRSLAREKFFDAMYRKGQQIGLGLTREQYTSAIGLNAGEVTTEDLCKIGIHATGYEELSKIWSQTSYMTTTQGVVKNFFVEGLIGRDPKAKSLTNYYYVLGTKGGSLNKKDQLPVRTIILAVEGPNGSTIVLATSASHIDTDEHNMFTNAKILCDIASVRMENGFDYDVSALEAQLTLDAAAVVILPKAGHIFNWQRYDWFGNDSRFCVYKKNSDMPIKTASTWKTMTAITALDYLNDLDQTILVKKSDLSSISSTPALEGGEIITFRDALYFMMLPSSNVAPNIIARGVGEMLVKKGY